MQLHHMNIQQQQQQQQQQQELIQQLQLMQRQYFIHQGFVKPLHVDFARQAHVLMPTNRATPPRGPVGGGGGTNTEQWPINYSPKQNEKDFQSIYKQNLQMDKLKSQQKQQHHKQQQQQMDVIHRDDEEDVAEEERRSILSANINQTENESNEDSLNGEDEEDEEEMLDKQKQNEQQKQQQYKKIIHIPKEEINTHEQPLEDLELDFELKNQQDTTDLKSNEELSNEDGVLKNSHKRQVSSPISPTTMEHQHMQTSLDIGSTRSSSSYHHQSILYEEMEASYTTQHLSQRKQHQHQQQQQQQQQQHNLTSSLSHIYFPNELNFHLQQQQQHHQSQDTNAEISNCGVGPTNLNHLFLNALNETSTLPLNDSEEEQKSKLYYHPLYLHGVCRWPGCELVLDNISTFVNFRIG